MVPVYQGLGADRLHRGNVVTDDGAQDRKLPVVKHCPPPWHSIIQSANSMAHWAPRAPRTGFQRVSGPPRAPRRSCAFRPGIPVEQAEDHAGLEWGWPGDRPDATL